MSLLGPVYVILSLSKRQEDALVGGWHALEGVQSATESVAFCLNTLLSKLDSAGDLSPEQQAQVEALIAQLKASQAPLAAAEAANATTPTQ
jgi:hypothetical protein